MTHSELTRAISFLRPGAQWVLTGESYADLTWLDGVQAKPTLAEIVAVDLSPAAEAARANLQARTDAVSLLADAKSIPKALRSIILLLVNELNILRQRDRDRSIDIAAATTLADLKIRSAARPSLDDRTRAQAINALQNSLNAGDAD